MNDGTLIVKIGDNVGIGEFFIFRIFPNVSDEELYLYRALVSQVEDAGHKLDTLALPEKLEAMFDKLPKKLKSEILKKEGLVKRVLAKRVEDIYRRMKDYLENACRKPQAAVQSAVVRSRQEQPQAAAAVATTAPEENSIPWYEQVD